MDNRELASYSQEAISSHFKSEENEDLFSSFFEVTPDLFFLLDSDCTIKDYKATKSSDLYIPPEQFIGKRMDEILPEHIGSMFKESITGSRYRNEMVSFEYDLMMPKGSQHFECRVNHLQDRDLLIAVVRNISEQYESLKALAASEDRFRNLLENAPFPVIIVCIKDGTMRYGNLRAQQQLGFSKSQGIGLPSSEFYLNSLDRDKFLECFHRQGFIQDYEICLLDWNHKPYWALMSASSVEYENEPAIMVSINDITIRKETDLALQKEQDNLRERLKEIRCTQEVFTISSNNELPVEELFMQLVNVIGQGWQYPDAALVRIEAGEHSYETDGFIETEWMQVKEAVAADDEILRLTVAYSEITAQHSEELFLKEEETLAQTIIDRLAEMVNRRRNLASIREKDDLVNLMFEQTIESIALLDPITNKFSSFNDSAHLRLGYTREEFYKLSVPDIQADHSLEVINRNIDMVVKGQQVSLETHHKCKNGALQEAIVTLTPINYHEKPFICVIWRDITLQNKQLRDLRVFSRAVEQSPASIVITNLDGIIEYANPMASKTTGYELEELIGNNPRVLKSGETSEDEYAQIWARISKGQEWKGIFHNKRKNGQLYWESSMITPIVDDEGNITNYLAIKEDITEHKLAEMELLKFRTISDQAHYGTSIASLDGRILYMNIAYAQMHGYETEELLGKTIDILYNNKQWPIISRKFEEIKITGGFVAEEIWRTRKDGSIFPTLTSANIIVNHMNIPEFMAVTVIDMTEMKSKEMEIRKLSLAIEQSPVAEVITDLNGVIQYVSPAFEKITDYSAEEVIGLHTRILKSGKTKDATYRNLWETIKSGKTWKGEWENRKKHGELYWEGISITPIFDDSENIINYLAIKEDITERKRAEQDRIGREVAEAANQAKSAFLSNMSHEIRTPLNAIIGFSQILKRDSSLGSKQLKHMNTILRSGEHLMNLINDILDLSRIEAGYHSLKPVDFNLHDLLEDIAMMLLLKTRDKGIELIVEKSEDLPVYITADEAKLRQVLINLLGNAVKFTDSGSVTLQARSESLSSNVKQLMRLVVAIEDTGPGISEQDSRHIFDAFYQTKAGQAAGGTGLGLAISRNLVELMGGSIRVESCIGKGSRFIFSVPIETAADRKQKTSKSHKNVLYLASGTGPYRILVADDREDNRELLRELLVPVGFEIRETVNGQETIEQFEKWRPHAILMDMSMPIVDGYETARRIKATEKGKDTLIIAVTASAFGSDEEKVLAAGTDLFLSKPFQSEELFKLLENVPGLRYVYETSAVSGLNSVVEPEPKKPRAMSQTDMEQLPGDLVESMAQAVEKGNMTMFRKLITQMEGINPDAAQELRSLAGQYDYEKLEKLLKLKR